MLPSQYPVPSSQHNTPARRKSVQHKDITHDSLLQSGGPLQHKDNETSVDRGRSRQKPRIPSTPLPTLHVMWINFGGGAPMEPGMARQTRRHISTPSLKLSKKSVPPGSSGMRCVTNGSPTKWALRWLAKTAWGSAGRHIREAKN